MLDTSTNAGLHDFVLTNVLQKYLKTGMRAVDLGAGTGVFAVRLRSLGCSVVAVDLDAGAFKADLPFRQVNLDDAEFHSQIGTEAFDLVTAVEVFEHVESPIGFLRNVGRLLAPQGIAILTTPNVDSSPARMKFLLTGKIRAMDEASEPTHISPIFWDLLVRQYLPRAKMRLVEHRVFPTHGFQLTRPAYAWAFRMLAHLLPGESLLGDNHVFVLRSHSNQIIANPRVDQ